MSKFPLNETGSSPPLPPERTEVLYNQDEIVRRVLEQCYTIKHKLDACIDVNGPSMNVIPNHPVTKAYIDMKERGVRLRFISEITKDNLKYCKELMKIGEIRHLDEVKGNFGVGDKRVYHGGTDTIKSGPPPVMIISTVQSFVKQQQYFFDMLWNKAIPAEQKIREIEEGIIPDFIETISDPEDIQRLEAKLVNSAEQEILIIFPTANTFHRQEDSGPIQLLKQLGHHLIKPELTIRIMTPADYRIKDTVLQLKEKFKQNIDIQYIQQSFETTASILVVDRKYSLSIEVRDDTKDIFNDLSIRLATYSNSTSTVLSYASIFESLWRQADIYEQLKESKIQLDDAQSQLHDMKQYVNDVLKEVHRIKS
jgi:Mg2+ and Co2+ transporter CorA